MQAQYRSDYAGEFVILETRWSGGKKTQSREWIANPIENHHISGRAACIGTDADRHKFDYTRLQQHRGGLLGSKKLQTYGTGAIAMTMRLDFAVELDSGRLTQLIEQGYDQDNIVYSTARQCIARPGHFYLIPLGPRLLLELIPVYLAAFDGHQEIFLLGYHNDSNIAHPSWPQQLLTIFAAYPGTRFFIVGEGTNMPDQLFDQANVAHQTLREFISYCDV
jgi:hypothetical protein